MNICNLPKTESDQIEVDKKVCFWLNQKRLGKLTKEEIQRRVDLLPEPERAMHKSALSRFGRIFLNSGLL